VLNTVVAGRLWLPFSLIEIAFRNKADRTISGAHVAGEDWLLARGRDGEALSAANVVGADSFRNAEDGEFLDDPIADAARMAARQLGRDRISRDDLIAHLMLGFWVYRCPEALAKQESPLQVWELIATDCAEPLDDSVNLQRVMGRLLLTRNRVAHHEPLLFRAKHVFTRAGDEKQGADLVTSLQGAVAAFLKDVELTVTTAMTIAPMAAKYIDLVPDLVRADIAPFEAVLTAERRRFREARDARFAAREAERSARLGESGQSSS
jgi:hypothetical protein